MSRPPVYAAKYSNVPVWVSTIKDVSVMRRQGDGWVNATHLLKVADFDKPRRTRILERDVQTGQHEKVQGGYGKYQGTWIPVSRAMELSEQVGILELVHDLLVYTPQEGVATKELPKQPKPVVSRKSGDANGGGSNGPSSQAKRARKINSVPSTSAGAGITRAQPMQSMPPAMGGSYPMQWQPQFSPQTPYAGPQGVPSHMTPQQMSQMGIPMPGMPQMPVMSLPGFQMSMQPYAAQHQASMGAPTGVHGTGDVTEIQRSSPSPSPSSSVLSSGSDAFSDDDRPYLGGQSFAGHSHSATNAEPAVAAARSSHSGVASGMSDVSRTPGPGQYMAEFSSRLLDFFMSPDKSIIPAILLHPQAGPHINQPIDDEGNTAFHWTCAIGQVDIMQALLRAGANMHALNNAGHTPLVRAITFTNNFESRTFPRVLAMLAETASYVDANGRTILHHITGTSSSRTRAAGSRYYAEILLAKLSESPKLLQSGFDAFIDHQDMNGDTALHIASRNNARRLAKVLLSYHASAKIPNKAGMTAEDALKQARVSAEAESDRLYHHGKHQPNHHDNANTYLDRQHHQGSMIDDEIPVNATPSLMAAHQTAQSLSNYLSEMAKTYDVDLDNKESDIAQVRQLLEQIRQKALATEQELPELEHELGSEHEVRAEIEELELEARKKANQLRGLIERSQARDLAIIVQKEETDIQDELKEQLENKDSFDETEQVVLVSRLREMQKRRRALADEIVVLYSNAGSREKIGKYRKLLAMCCEVPEADVDGLLDGITQALNTQTA